MITKEIEGDEAIAVLEVMDIAPDLRRSLISLAREGQVVVQLTDGENNVLQCAVGNKENNHVVLHTVIGRAQADK